MSKKLRIVPILVLILVMCFSSIASVFAAQPEGTETSPAEAAITKLFKVPHGTDVPETTFKFKVEPVSIDDDTDEKPTLDGIGLNDDGIIEIEFPGVYTFKETIDDTDYYYLESASLFENVEFENAGIYEYKITEFNTTFINNGTILDDNYEIMYFSKAVYTIKVYVKDGDEGTYIYWIGAVRTTDDDGDEDGVKVDPTPGKTDTEHEYSEMIFTNVYVKSNGGGDEKDPDNWTFNVNKTVDGEYGNKSKYFKFSLTLTQPSLIADELTFKGYVVEKDPDNPGDYIVVTNTDNGADSGKDYIEFKFGNKDVEFYLKHGQYLVFKNVPVGTSYEIIEYGTSGYEPSVKIYIAEDAGIAFAGEKGKSLKLPQDLDFNNIDHDYLFVGEGNGNSTDFTNTNNATPATGIDLNNLPFIILIVLGLGTIVMLIITKNRKRDTID